MVSDSTLGSLIDSDSNCLAPDNDEVVGTFESTALSEASESILRSDGTAGTGSDVPGVESNVVVTAAGAPPAAPTGEPTKRPPKTPKGESNEGPMGELRPTDVLAGNYRKRAGNFLYKRLLRENAPHVGKVEMRVLVARIVDAIFAQDPPGRFIREGGDGLINAAQRNQKIARALREVAERTSKEDSEANNVSDAPKGETKSTKKNKAESDRSLQEPIGEIRPTDVITGNYRKRPGNYLYKKLLRLEAPNVAHEEIRAVVNRVIDGIHNQVPPGRFIREGGGGLLTRGQIHQKVARALREVVERTDKEGDEKEAGGKIVRKKPSMSEKQEPLGEIRPTDVLTGNYRKRPGNALFKALLRQHAPDVGREEISVIVARVVDGIRSQDPPGRFIREGGGALLTRGQVRQKVARALREVVDRTKAEKAALPPPLEDAPLDDKGEVNMVHMLPLEEPITTKVEGESVKEDDLLTDEMVEDEEPLPPAAEEWSGKVEAMQEEEQEEVHDPQNKPDKTDNEEKVEEEEEIKVGRKVKKEPDVDEVEPKTRKTRRGGEAKEEAKPPQTKKTRKK